MLASALRLSGQSRDAMSHASTAVQVPRAALPAAAEHPALTVTPAPENRARKDPCPVRRYTRDVAPHARAALTPSTPPHSYNAAVASGNHAGQGAIYPELASTHGVLVRGLHEIARCLFTSLLCAAGAPPSLPPPSLPPPSLPPPSRSPSSQHIFKQGRCCCRRRLVPAGACFK
jgi:hypothetical protein